MGPLHKGHVLGHGVRALLAIGMIWSALQGQSGTALLLLASLAATLIAYRVTRHALAETGPWLDLLFALLIAFNNLFGLALDFYTTIPFWDAATHYTTGIFLAVSALVLVQRAYPPLVMQAPKPTIVVALALFSLGLGGLWEIGEFASDALRMSTFQGNLNNTMQDLIVDLIAGLVVGVAWVSRKESKR